MSYFRMNVVHTIIGAERFHFWVRDGFRWFPLAIFTRQLVVIGFRRSHRDLRSLYSVCCKAFCFFHPLLRFSLLRVQTSSYIVIGFYFLPFTSQPFGRFLCVLFFCSTYLFLFLFYSYSIAAAFLWSPVVVFFQVNKLFIAYCLLLESFCHYGRPARRPYSFVCIVQLFYALFLLLAFQPPCDRRSLSGRRKPGTTA